MTMTVSDFKIVDESVRKHCQHHTSAYLNLPLANLNRSEQYQ